MKVSQEEIQSWWQENPMTYDWRRTMRPPEMSREYFEEIDRRFFSSAWFAQEKRQKAFSALINYEALRNKDVLEVGCGSGAHSRLLVESGCRLTAIDLTSRAVELTRRRLELWELKANIFEADAEQLPFPDESFDYVWSWGVIHHSENTERALKEMCRVLRPGGQISIMVYHRTSLCYWVNFIFVHGVLMGKLLTMSMEEICNRYSDGAIARHYTKQEIRSLFAKYCRPLKIGIFGQMTELLPLPGFLREPLIKIAPMNLKEFILTRWGHFLFVTGIKSTTKLETT